MSNGWNASGHVEEFKAVERRMIEAALARGVQPRCEIGSPEQAKYYVDLGVRHFSLGDEIGNATRYWSQQGGALRTIVGELR